MSCSRPYETVNEIITTLSDGDVSRCKSAFLTLHFLFPHELLPALDLLDRQLVTRHIVSGNSEGPQRNEVHYVQSASATAFRPTKTSRHQTLTTTAYEVRLAAWNCSCPAFAYSAFGKSFQSILNLDQQPAINQSQELFDITNDKARLGGVLTQVDAGVPMCKHILAALLSSAAPNMFFGRVCTKEVDEAEVAGWAGGWGD